MLVLLSVILVRVLPSVAPADQAPRRWLPPRPGVRSTQRVRAVAAGWEEQGHARRLTATPTLAPRLQPHSRFHPTACRAAAHMMTVIPMRHLLLLLLTSRVVSVPQQACQMPRQACPVHSGAAALRQLAPDARAGRAIVV